MDEVSFEWNHGKGTANIKKHKVSFDEASTVFDDPLAAIFHDKNHSTDEVREIIIGHSKSARILLVCFTEKSKNLVRIFSTRVATKKERKDYEENFPA